MRSFGFQHSALSSRDEEQYFDLREILFDDGEKRKIMTQNVNGPCPLIAITNGLVLGDRFSFNRDEFEVSLTRVSDSLSEMIRFLGSKNLRGDSKEIVDDKVESALLALRKCSKGLDVNMRFGRVDNFEFTHTLALFDILEIKLIHGWIPDERTLSLISNRTYNEISAYVTQESDDSRSVKEWLDLNPTQLTMEGLEKLKCSLRDGEVAVLFRNNHFSTITKYNGTLFTLVSDCGFKSIDGIVFESLVDVNQSSSFFTNGRFEEVNANGRVKQNRTEESATNSSNSNHISWAEDLEKLQMRRDERERREGQKEEERRAR
ncbi:hypothetical protein PMAYCL1PPCAC_25438, partial [Pristionchus mayeri]